MKNGVGARHRRAEQAGAEAFRRGVPFEDNPYPDTGGMAYKSEWAFWQGGWRTAEYAASLLHSDDDRCDGCGGHLYDPARYLMRASGLR